MLKTVTYGKVRAWISIALGVAGAAAAVALVVDVSEIAVVVVLAIIAFHLSIGWRTLRLSSRAVAASEPAMRGSGEPANAHHVAL